MLYNGYMNAKGLSLYITTEHPCGYYDDRLSANLIPDPHVQMNHGLYSLLITKGFRRSGGFVYRPYCPQCNQCQPCRINVEHFIANRNQRRCLKRNQDLHTRIIDSAFSNEYFQLYKRYINSRHGDGTMANPNPDDYTNFLLNDWSQTLFIESRKDQQLLCVAVVDFMPSGLSAVYTFFDPEEHKRSLGTFAILQQIWLAQLYQLPYVYLGYWIPHHPKMDYKCHFRALEILHGTEWQSFDSDLK